ncbi:cathepsin L1 [Biomphalaria pfeifferi]|uniref:Cathepsin L1 n=1 Tax=Biomphalaria pfeifferi TaxID=112525 RepID=A0AAD8EWX0_BIOPF|nr:cathepsin L1 [Biomphalaria pfeifferi]
MRTLIRFSLAVFLFDSFNCAILQHAQTRPDRFDWRDYGVITPVSDQGMIGDPVDFVIAEGIESLFAIQTKTKAIPLSKQEVADCCDDPSTHQPLYKGFDCIVALGGLCVDYSYKNGTGTCNNGSCTPVGKITGTGYIPAGREDFMLKVIHLTPIAVFIDAGQSSFEMYTSGIYSDPSCSSTQLDHAVQIVGYGTEAGVDYWTVKNSWGPTWGEQGYMRIVRGKNMCGIASMAFYPLNK